MGLVSIFYTMLIWTACTCIGGPSVEPIEGRSICASFSLSEANVEKLPALVSMAKKAGLKQYEDVFYSEAEKPLKQVWSFGKEVKKRFNFSSVIINAKYIYFAPNKVSHKQMWQDAMKMAKTFFFEEYGPHFICNQPGKKISVDDVKRMVVWIKKNVGWNVAVTQ